MTLPQQCSGLNCDRPGLCRDTMDIWNMYERLCKLTIIVLQVPGGTIDRSGGNAKRCRP